MFNGLRRKLSPLSVSLLLRFKLDFTKIKHYIYEETEISALEIAFHLKLPTD